MEVLKLLLLGTALVSGFLMLLGLISPWIVLWWMDHQNRLKVLKLYGSIFLVSGVAYYIFI
jgi:hypothetical protein